MDVPPLTEEMFNQSMDFYWGIFLQLNDQNQHALWSSFINFPHLYIIWTYCTEKIDQIQQTEEWYETAESLHKYIEYNNIVDNLTAACRNGNGLERNIEASRNLFQVTQNTEIISV